MLWFQLIAHADLIFNSCARYPIAIGAPVEPFTICDQFLRRDPVYLRQVRLQHDAVAPNGMESVGNIPCPKG